MPWLCDHTSTRPSGCQSATAQLGAIDACATNGRRYVADTVVPEIPVGVAVPSLTPSSTTSIVSCGPARRNASRASSSGSVSVSAQPALARTRSAARSTAASSGPATARNDPSRTTVMPSPATPASRSTSRAPGEGGRSTRANHWPGNRRSCR